LQQFCAAASQNSAANLDPVVQLRMIQDLHHRMHRAGFRIVRTIHQTLNPGMHQRPSAHGARFNCSKEVAAFQAMVTNGSTGLPQRDDLGVRGWVHVRNVPVPSAANDAAIADDDRAHRYFSSFQRALGAAKRFFHPQLVGVTFVGREFVSAKLGRGGLQRWILSLGMIASG
jgi:hypothetical protein